ncbi:hypothetical protein MNBD_GAMMA18-447 [hydrothermal vent metagenome]|uniref:PilZ domain-containing protein n=1 Tax=hydrothermal vent metagenome TaxID=652676 RepID=A0A3B0YY71_9ZZZZ
MLEHRWLQRRASRLRVRLYKQGEAIGTSCAIDMNSQGIGVECGGLDFHEGEIVEIDLSENAIPEGMESSVRCLVIHAGKARCGLMFLDVAGVD